MEQQLQPAELQALRRMRSAAKTYREIGEAVGITERAAHRILTIPDYVLSDITLIKIRLKLEALQEHDAAPVKRRKTA